MTLDEGAQTRLFPAPTSTPMGKPDIAALWWPTKDGYGLAEAELAAVIDIDNASRVQILASTPLPPVTESPLLLGPPRLRSCPPTTSANGLHHRRPRVPTTPTSQNRPSGSSQWGRRTTCRGVVIESGLR